MNRPSRSDEIASPFECQCIGAGGCYELIPPGMVHECDRLVRFRRWLRKWPVNA